MILSDYGLLFFFFKKAAANNISESLFIDFFQMHQLVYFTHVSSTDNINFPESPTIC